MDLSHLKVGDRLYIQRGSAVTVNSITILTIVGETKTQWVTQNLPYCRKYNVRKADGLLIGSGSDWYRPIVKILTKEVVDQYQNDANWIRAISVIDNFQSRLKICQEQHDTLSLNAVRKLEISITDLTDELLDNRPYY